MVSTSARCSAATGTRSRADIAAVTEAAHRRGAIVKVIFENCYLNDAQKIRLCQICGEVRADYVKTSTGYGTGGATRRRPDPDAPGLAAARQAQGRRRRPHLDAAIACAELGCDRIGASKTAEILDELKRGSAEAIARGTAHDRSPGRADRAHATLCGAGRNRFGASVPRTTNAMSDTIG